MSLLVCCWIPFILSQRISQHRNWLLLINLLNFLCCWCMIKFVVFFVLEYGVHLGVSLYLCSHQGSKHSRILMELLSHVSFNWGAKSKFTWFNVPHLLLGTLLQQLADLSLVELFSHICRDTDSLTFHYLLILCLLIVKSRVLYIRRIVTSPNMC